MAWIPRCCPPPPCNSSTPGTSPMWSSAIPTRVGGEPHITIGYGPVSRFHCPEAGCGEASCPVHDTMERTWRHLNFFQYKAFIDASVPRVACPEHGVRTVTVPWTRPGSGVRAPVRGDGRGTGEKPACGGRRRTGRRARHETVAVHKALRAGGAPVRGLHGCGDGSASTRPDAGATGASPSSPT